MQTYSYSLIIGCPDIERGCGSNMEISALFYGKCCIWIKQNTPEHCC